jgi:hypothetical protein
VTHEEYNPYEEGGYDEYKRNVRDRESPQSNTSIFELARKVKKSLQATASSQKEQSIKSRGATVITACKSLLAIPDSEDVREDIETLMNKAINFEHANDKEYCMTRSECNFLMDVKKRLSSELKTNNFSRFVTHTMKTARYRINRLIHRWKIFTANGKRGETIEKIKIIVGESSSDEYEY